MEEREANYIAFPREIEGGKSCAIAVASPRSIISEREWRLLNRPIDDTNSTSPPSSTTTFALLEDEMKAP